jgi:hypothetical protein
LLKLLQLYDNCMQPGCVPDWLRAIKQSSTAKRRRKNALPEVILISDDEDREIIDAESADTSTDAIESTNHVHKRVKVEPVESCDEATSSSTSAKVGSPSHDALSSADMTQDSLLITGDTSAVEESNESMMITEQTTAMAVIADNHALNVATMQMETGDTAMEVDHVAAAATDNVAAIVDKGQPDLLQCIAVTKQPADTNNSDTSDTRNMAPVGDKCCDTELKADEVATDMSTASSTSLLLLISL